MGLWRTFCFSVVGVILYFMFFTIAVGIQGSLINYQWNGSVGEIAPMFIVPLLPLGIILYELAMYFNPEIKEGDDNIYSHARDRAERKVGYYREKAREYGYQETTEEEQDEEEQREEQEGIRSGKMTKEEAYEFMGLQPNATKEQIRKAYREIGKVVHPDISGVNTNTIMKKLNEAKEVLEGD